MTNINCASNCIYQKDGKCNLDKTLVPKFTSNSDCAYYKSSDVQNKKR